MLQCTAKNRRTSDPTHYWNAVKVDGQWFYVDPCYTDVYTEVMSRDRVETDGDMNHTYFLFSDTSARKLYDGNFSSLRSLYENEATDKTYGDSMDGACGKQCLLCRRLCVLHV